MKSTLLADELAAASQSSARTQSSNRHEHRSKVSQYVHDHQRIVLATTALALALTAGFVLYSRQRDSK